MSYLGIPRYGTVLIISSYSNVQCEDYFTVASLLLVPLSENECEAKH